MGSSTDAPVSTSTQDELMNDAGVSVQPSSQQALGGADNQMDDREPLGGYLIPEESLTFDEDGLPVLTDVELEAAARVLQLFYRFPEAAIGARFVKYSREYHLRQNIRINAMRWLKPGNVPSVKTILKTKHTNELEVLHASGIRLGRNRKKRVLPSQLGQVYIENEQENIEMLEAPVVATSVLDNSSAMTTTNIDERDENLTPITVDEKGYNIPAKQAAENFRPCQRKELSENFRVHPAVDAAPLSGASAAVPKVVDPSIISEAMTSVSRTQPAPTSSQANSDNVSGSVHIEIIDDTDVSEGYLEPASKRVKSMQSFEFARSRHVSNFHENNPQPKGDTLIPDAETYAPTPAVLSALGRASTDELRTTLSISAATKIDPTTASEFLKVDVPIGLQTTEQTARIAQRYARSFTGAAVPLTGAGVSVGTTAASTGPTAAFVEDDEEEDVLSPSGAQDGMSRENKIVKKGKQEQQAWSSKESLYGGSVKVVDEDIVPDVDVEAALQADAQTYETPANEGRPRALKKAIPCYVCKTHFKVLHHFYDRLCPTCAEFNFKKRFQTADMVIRRRDKKTGQLIATPRVCLVTGARVKIGYEIAVKLLRAGAFVIATSRFAHDTALRLAKEDDFDQWKDRVHVYALDFRVISSVEMFANYVSKKYARLDMIMNNAAQTIRRPPQFYRHLLDTERVAKELLPAHVQHIVQDFISPEFRKAAAGVTAGMLQSFGLGAHSAFALESKPTKPDMSMSDTTEEQTVVENNDETTPKSVTKEDNSASTTSNANAMQIYDDPGSMSTRMVTLLSMPSAAAINPAELTQLPLIKGDEDKPEDAKIFPVGLLDKDDQQIDLRDRQTWVLQADEVSTVELAEVQLVNSMSPFILNTKLKPLMRRSGDPTWIINVSSMEGKFRGFKDTTHPHTNMAKAALNMFTHTSAKDYAHDRIFMNAVDTGWVTEELPHAIAVHKANIGFAPPLDENDGASRCLDPVFTSLLTGVYEYGKFFKDYGEGHW